MSKERSLLILGLVIMAFPNLGFPNSVEKIFAAILGLLVILVGYRIYFERSSKKQALTHKPKFESQTPKIDRTVDLRPSNKKFEQKEEITGFTYVNGPSSATPGMDDADEEGQDSA